MRHRVHAVREASTRSILNIYNIIERFKLSDVAKALVSFPCGGYARATQRERPTMGVTESRTKVQVQSKDYDPCNLYVDSDAGKPYFSRVQRPTINEAKKQTDETTAIEKTMELQSVTEMP
ncbi:hypothetical protein NP493_220g00043 [Ridgeia piscesae]|uniref:Uncharacterized protein n=1 Tax=Ridgeia piscesae TaxID=27915 RepID=A0AAD9P0G9_RIDPI|nr:hypothetical protein NP493_220g00043 [Ridgeia piscesae]